MTRQICVVITFVCLFPLLGISATVDLYVDVITGKTWLHGDGQRLIDAKVVSASGSLAEPMIVPNEQFHPLFISPHVYPGESHASGGSPVLGDVPFSCKFDVSSEHRDLVFTYNNRIMPIQGNTVYVPEPQVSVSGVMLAIPMLRRLCRLKKGRSNAILELEVSKKTQNRIT